MTWAKGTVEWRDHQRFVQRGEDVERRQNEANERDHAAMKPLMCSDDSNAATVARFERGYQAAFEHLGLEPPRRVPEMPKWPWAELYDSPDIALAERVDLGFQFGFAVAWALAQWEGAKVT